MEEKYTLKAYKGFNKDMTCKGFQYAEGGEYEIPENEVKICNKGFHSCERPLDVLNYYDPAQSVYHEVEIGGKMDKEGDDTKVASSRIKVGARLDIRGLVRAQIEYVKEHCTTEHTDPKLATAGEYGAATAGEYGAATAGYCGAATAGYCGAATAGGRGAATAGYCGAATAGYCGAATAGGRGAATAGYCGVATAGGRGAATAGGRGAATAGGRGAATAGEYGAATAGDCGAATAGGRGAATAGDCGAATAGDCGAATAGDRGAATSRGSVAVGENGVATARATNPKAKGGLGAVLVLARENEDDYNLAEWKAEVVDGKRIKAGTWYTLKNGQFIECE